MNRDWLATAVLEDYLDGKLDASEMHQVELHALEDPFVAEALAGLSESPKRSLQTLSLLQKQLHDRVAQQKSHKKHSVYTWQRLSIAAAAAVLFIAVSIVFWMKDNAARNQRAQQQDTVTTYLTNAQPVGGYQAYQTYLEKNNRLKGSKIHEMVNLTFQVQQNGQAEAIQILKTPGKAYSDEAVRLVMEGPKWELPKNGPNKVSLSIGF
ncbi:hypothetical protein [Pedobacter immunditicola]|uniref:hypothetical protein n=1 Tax=Pedobacter immunditicola TaxID=3133440 RepID=UPI0030B3A393